MGPIVAWINFARNLVQNTQLVPISSNNDRPWRMKQKLRDFLNVDSWPEWMATSVWIQSAKEYANGDQQSTTGVNRFMFWAATEMEMRVTVHI